MKKLIIANVLLLIAIYLQTSITKADDDIKGPMLQIKGASCAGDGCDAVKVEEGTEFVKAIDYVTDINNSYILIKSQNNSCFIGKIFASASYTKEYSLSLYNVMKSLKDGKIICEGWPAEKIVYEMINANADSAKSVIDAHTITLRASSSAQ